MTRENPLSHHENLRYDYLLKNIHYLNEKERIEFDFLHSKLEGQQKVSEIKPYEELEEQPQQTNNIGLPSYGNRSRSSRHKVSKQKLRK